MARAILVVTMVVTRAGFTVWDQMITLYEKYCYFKESQYSITMKGIDGAKEIEDLMNKLRSNPPKNFGDLKVKEGILVSCVSSCKTAITLFQTEYIIVGACLLKKFDLFADELEAREKCGYRAGYRPRCRQAGYLCTGYQIRLFLQFFHIFVIDLFADYHIESGFLCLLLIHGLHGMVIRR